MSAGHDLFALHFPESVYAHVCVYETLRLINSFVVLARLTLPDPCLECFLSPGPQPRPPSAGQQPCRCRGDVWVLHCSQVGWIIDGVHAAGDHSACPLRRSPDEGKGRIAFQHCKNRRMHMKWRAKRSLQWVRVFEQSKCSHVTSCTSRLGQSTSQLSC